MQLTAEMRTAMDVLRRVGVTFQPTQSRSLPCGCVVLSGWNVETYEPALGFTGCSTGHTEAFARVQRRWQDPDVVKRVGAMLAIDSAVLLLREEIERG